MGQVRPLFPPMTPMPFDRATVEGIEEAQLGCYGLLRGKTMVYIGAGDIRARLLAHLDGDVACLAREAPTHWVAVQTPHHQALLREFLREYDPPCNR